MIENQESKVIYNGDGASKTFAVPFTFKQNVNELKKWQLQVVLRHATETEETVLSENTDYGVSGNSVIFNIAPTVGDIVAILRDVPPAQKTSFLERGSFPVKDNENTLDTFAMKDQQQDEQLARAVLMPATADEKPQEFVSRFFDAAKKAEGDAADAKASAESAFGSKTAAGNSADAAAAAAQAAQAAKLAAQSAAANAEICAQAASESEDNAQNSAEHAEDVVESAVALAAEALETAQEKLAKGQIRAGDNISIIENADGSITVVSTAGEGKIFRRIEEDLSAQLDGVKQQFNITADIDDNFEVRYNGQGQTKGKHYALNAKVLTTAFSKPPKAGEELMLIYWKGDGKTPVAGVTSVNGKEGNVTLSAQDVGLGNVENTRDADKPVSQATVTAIAEAKTQVRDACLNKEGGELYGDLVLCGRGFAEETEVPAFSQTFSSGLLGTGNYGTRCYTTAMGYFVQTGTQNGNADFFHVIKRGNGDIEGPFKIITERYSGKPFGYAPLGSDGKIDKKYLPDINISGVSLGEMIFNDPVNGTPFAFNVEYIAPFDLFLSARANNVVVDIRIKVNDVMVQIAYLPPGTSVDGGYNCTALVKAGERFEVLGGGIGGTGGQQIFIRRLFSPVW